MYINIIKSLSKSNKYTKTYCSIISNRIECPYTDGYSEVHHIVPSSFTDSNKYRIAKNNTVRLSSKEHYICHLLLTKMLIDDKLLKKARFALYMMSCDNSRGRYSGTRYSKARAKFSENMKALWQDEDFRKKMIASRQLTHTTDAFREMNREKALIEMQDPVKRAAFVKAGLDAGKVKRDKDPKAWVKNSLGSDEAKAKAKATVQTSTFREACSKRELSKPKEDRLKLAHMGQQALVAKCGGEEGYRKMLSTRIKGRKKYINPVSKEVRVTKEPIEGWELLVNYNKKYKGK